MMMIRTLTTLIYCQVSTLPDLVQSFMNNPEIPKLKQQQQLSVRKHHQHTQKAGVPAISKMGRNWRSHLPTKERLILEDI